MLKLSWFAVVLAVICLPVILLSVEADAQPTVDETTQCGSYTLEEVATKKDIKEIMDEIEDVKKLLASLITEISEAKNVTNSLKCDAGNTSTLACEYNYGSCN